MAFSHPQWASWMCVSMSSGSSLGRKALRSVSQRLWAVFCSSLPWTVSGYQHKVFLYQKVTTHISKIFRPDLKVGHVGAGVGFGFVSGYDGLSWKIKKTGFSHWVSEQASTGGSELLGIWGLGMAWSGKEPRKRSLNYFSIAREITSWSTNLFPPFDWRWIKSGEPIWRK